MHNEEVLWRRYRRTGDKRCRQRLCAHYNGLVVSTVLKYDGSGVGLDRRDLYSEGCIGLLKAIDTFDPSRKVRFTTHAVTRIRSAIMHAIRDASFYSAYQQEKWAREGGRISEPIAVSQFPEHSRQRLELGALVGLDAPYVPLSSIYERI